MEKTIVLRKEDHWYVFSSKEDDEQEILITLLEYAENINYNIEKGEVLQLIDQLGWEVEHYDELGMAS